MHTSKGVLPLCCARRGSCESCPAQEAVLSRDCATAEAPGQSEQQQHSRGPSLPVALDDGLKSLFLNHEELGVRPGAGIPGGAVGPSAATGCSVRC